MDTKPCPFCGEPILVAAIKCKHCGEFLEAKPTAKAEPPKADVGQLIQGLLTLAAVGVFIWWMMKPTDCSGEKKQAEAEAQTAARASEVVTAEQLTQAYRDNEVAAQRRFQGKTIEVTGMVSEVRRNSFDDVAVVVLESSHLMGVSLSFSKSQESSISKLSKGQGVRARCIGDENVMGVNLKGCRLL